MGSCCEYVKIGSEMCLERIKRNKTMLARDIATLVFDSNYERDKKVFEEEKKKDIQELDTAILIDNLDTKDK